MLLAIPAVLAAAFIPLVVVLLLHQVGAVRAVSGKAANGILPYFNFATSVIFYGLLLAIVAFLAARRWGRPWARLGVRRPPLWVLVLMPPLALGLQILTGLISIVLSPLLGGMKNPQVCSISQGFGAEPYLGVISIAVIAPVVEEVVFRGFVYGGLRHRLGVPAALVISSAVFALAHSLSVGGSILLLAPSLFIAGLVLAWVYERTKSLVPGMLLHATFNLIAVLAIFAVGHSAASCH